MTTPVAVTNMTRMVIHKGKFRGRGKEMVGREGLEPPKAEAA